MITSSEIRRKFIDFFKRNGHLYIKPSLLIQDNDPTLMFTNAGMNQFKNIFLDKKPITDTRYVNSQLCLRVSGKHNDLDEIGADGYHHTLFEMLGNWSMNDYFKEDAIKFSWELLTEEFKLDKERLYVTVFAGDDIDKIEKDIETLEIWSKYIDKDHIILCNKKDNFWEMGEIGPCGPCTEIHIDIRDVDEINKIPGKVLVNKGHPEVIEIWNIVFIQYQRLIDNSLMKLSKHFIDTGMGLERITMVLQNKKSNYDTDIFIDYIRKLEHLTGKRYSENKKTDIAFRIIVDHIRAIVLTISQGLIPSNIKQGYVIRHILRRAVQYGYSSLDIKEPFLYQFVDEVLNKFDFISDTFVTTPQRVKDTMFLEEKNFFNTLMSGIKRLDNIIKNSNSETIDAKYIFELHDTFGFPVDLTEAILKENNLSFDKTEYKNLMLEQKNRSRNDRADTNSEWIEVENNDNCGTKFVGYGNVSCKSKILKYRKIDDYYQIIFKETPFFGESGGQIGDTGDIIDSNNIKYEVFDAKKIGNDIIHFLKILPRNLEDTFTLQINYDRRLNISKNHTCTHLLHYALRYKFGDNIRQMGSKIYDNKLRFDFNFNRVLTDDELNEIKCIINDKINKGCDLIKKIYTNANEAKNDGFIGLFTDKYNGNVQAIQIGDFSKELCCGTHVNNTSEISIIKNIKCKSVASGVKRIEILN